MNTIRAFLQLIRWTNLLFIGLTQIIFYFFIVQPLILSSGMQGNTVLTDQSLALLMVASICIAAAGNIINDYFDVNIDLINKPERVVLEINISRRAAILLHLVLSFIGLLLSLYLSLTARTLAVLIGNMLAIILLWAYSAGFKKRLLSGNILIALLTAWILWVVYFAAGGRLFYYYGFQRLSGFLDLRKLYLITAVYSGFAFITTIVREVIKDMEDREGDEKHHCKTIPIVWGIPAAKIFCLVWLSVLIVALAGISGYAFLSGWWWLSIYLSLLVMLPSIFVFRSLQKAISVKDYHRLSNNMKYIMLTGVLSICLFKFIL